MSVFSFPRSAWERFFGRSASLGFGKPNHRRAVEKTFPRRAWERGKYDSIFICGDDDMVTATGTTSQSLPRDERVYHPLDQLRGIIRRYVVVEGLLSATIFLV